MSAVRAGRATQIRLLAASHVTNRAVCFVKEVWTVNNGDAVPVVLEHDLFSGGKLTAGTDFWPVKSATDLVVRGAAVAADGVPTAAMQVRVRVRAVEKRIHVFGDRAIVWRRGRPAIEPAQPFTSMPLTWDRAYGGLDWRVRAPDVVDPLTALRLRVDHPGAYPRNSVGRGYLVMDGEVPDMRMPNLEDPGDLLSESRLVVGEPGLWWKQPLPWCFDFVHPTTFPRCVYFGGADAWFPGPQDDSMPEVARGYLSAGYRAAPNAEDIPRLGFFQEASHGLVVRDLVPGDHIRIEGMNASRPVVTLALPAPPRVVFEVDGRREPAAPRLHTVLCEPNEERLAVTYAAPLDLPRPFIPGVHKHIPVSAFVDGDRTDFNAPMPIRERVHRGISEGALDVAKEWL